MFERIRCVQILFPDSDYVVVFPVNFVTCAVVAFDKIVRFLLGLIGAMKAVREADRYWLTKNVSQNNP